MRGFLLSAFAVSMIAASVAPSLAQTTRNTEVAQVQRQRVVVTPGRTTPGPNSTRECQARLVQQHRPSGTVIVPVMNCWWQ